MTTDAVPHTAERRARRRVEQELGLAVHTAYVVGDLGRMPERLVQRELDRARGR